MTKEMTDSTVLVCFILVLCDLSQTFAASVLSSENDFSTRDRFETVATYFKDHEVSERQARENLIGMTEKDFNRPAYCTNCTQEHQRYCHSPNLLKDHCCCNQSHKTEQLYFIPHTCFVNEERCTPSLGSCLTIMEIRNCCCDPQLKRHWKSILAGASSSRSSKYLSLLLALLVARISI